MVPLLLYLPLPHLLANAQFLNDVTFDFVIIGWSDSLHSHTSLLRCSTSLIIIGGGTAGLLVVEGYLSFCTNWFRRQNWDWHMNFRLASALPHTDIALVEAGERVITNTTLIPVTRIFFWSLAMILDFKTQKLSNNSSVLTSIGTLRRYPRPMPGIDNSPLLGENC